MACATRTANSLQKDVFIDTSVPAWPSATTTHPGAGGRGKMTAASLCPGRNLTLTFGSGGPPKGGGLGPGPINYSDANPADFLPALGSSLRRGVRPGSISRCSRIPNHWQSGSTSAEPRAPTAGEVAAAGPTAAGAPRVPSPPDHVSLLDLASRGSYASPSCRRCPSPGSTDRPGTSDNRAREPGPRWPRGSGRRPVRKRPKPTRHPPARSYTAEPTVSFALQSPSPKICVRPDSRQVVIPRQLTCGMLTARCYSDRKRTS